MGSIIVVVAFKSPVGQNLQGCERRNPPVLLNCQIKCYFVGKFGFHWEICDKYFGA